MALWRNDAFGFVCGCYNDWVLAKERRGAAEVNAHRQEDGDIEHTQEKHVKMTHSCEKKFGSLLCDSKNPQQGRKNKVAVECAVEKDSRTEKPQIADAARTHKDAKLQESS